MLLVKILRSKDFPQKNLYYLYTNNDKLNTLSIHINWFI